MKRSIRYGIAMLGAKGSTLALKALHRNASYFPGKFAVTADSRFIGEIGRPDTVIVVTGTNGKTTCSNMIADALTACGYELMNNSLGSNTNAGVASALIAGSTWTGKPKKSLAIFEVDERSTPKILPFLKPDYIVCTNIMRDSIKRNANTDFISYIVSGAIPKESRLIVNGDDIICSRLGSKENSRTYFGISYKNGDEKTGTESRDITYCPECGQELTADYLRYNHIGRVHCTHCGFRSPEPDWVVEAIDKEAGCFTMSHHGEQEVYPLVNDNITSMYNCAAVITLLREFGISAEKTAEVLSRTAITETRYNSATVNGKTVTMQMAKGQNPVACSRAYDYLRAGEGDDKVAILIVDDLHDNIGNSETVSWLYDTDYSAFADPSVKKIIIGGPRRRDHLLRAMLDGVDPSRIVLVENDMDTINELNVNETNHIYILFELYRVDEAETLFRRVQEKIRKEASL